ncbi:unnamed protein product [Xylocopa violacea]|uniref:Uncharacterized protein n=1 Tax=Xylocopa violacea TaxID=135666 RepID=A0ABP1NV38_XYLVO
MLKYMIIVACINIYTTFTFSKSAKTNKHLKRLQHHEHYAEATKYPDANQSFTGISAFKDRASLKMLDDITIKVWRTLPVINVPQSWVLSYCIKYTEVSEKVEKATMQCQYDGTDWDCTFIELGGGRDDFNMGNIVSLFTNISNRGLRMKLLRGAEICGRIWQRYKQIQDKRLVRMRLNVRGKDREKRSSRKTGNSQGLKVAQKKLKEKRGKKRGEEIKKKRRAAKRRKAIQQKLTQKIMELENKDSLTPKEEIELDRLRLTKAPINLEDYSLAEERAELSRLQEIGLCLTQQTTKACESVVLDAIQKLI